MGVWGGGTQKPSSNVKTPDDAECCGKRKTRSKNGKGRKTRNQEFIPLNV